MFNYTWVWKRIFVRWFVLFCGIVILFWCLDRAYPIPIPGRDAPYATLVLARDGSPLRAFPDKGHIWRHAIRYTELSPYYLEALIGYEDRFFYWHYGINPWGLIRAAAQWLQYGRVVSGGSTLSMQVARILDPTPRTLRGKFKQIARAIQLEMHYSKNDILNLYLNYAPMGGVLEGVEAASRAYLGKSARQLSHAEAALLAVLPQKPSVWRPDRYPERAQHARDKLIRRMTGIWSEETIKDALTEPVVANTLREPLLAPLLALRLHQSRMRQSGIQNTIATTIDPAAQQMVEALLKDRIHHMPPHVSMAALVMQNSTHEVLAYAGSADFFDRERFSDVDMIQASRSPGSALKPFLYAFALDEGLIHSESLLSDTPQSFSGYQPGNFQQSFHGPVSVSEALVKSLNVPAVQVLEQLEPTKFVSLLRRGGLVLDFPRGATPNLSVILGGAGVRLEHLVGAYASLARKGVAVTPRLTPHAPYREYRMMSEGAAFIIREILENGGAGGSETIAVPRGIAWKTGTSFGFRDAWAIGVSERYTIGVWVGRPDGTPNPGFFGANVAAPLLVDIFHGFPNGIDSVSRMPPATVQRAKICWPLGRLASLDIKSPTLCPIQRTAWLLNGAAPPTFPERGEMVSPILHYFVDQTTGLRVTSECTRHAIQEHELARWPKILLPWLASGLGSGVQRMALPPPWAKECAMMRDSTSSMQIEGASDGEVLRGIQNQPPKIRLWVRGASFPIDWIVNGRWIARSKPYMAQHIIFSKAGHYDITALDASEINAQGRYDHIQVSVQ